MSHDRTDQPQREDVRDLVALTEQLADHEVELALLVTASIAQRRGLRGENVANARRLLADLASQE